MKVIGWFPLTLVVKGPLKRGANATHGPLFIRIREDIEHFKAVLAQERYEWWFMFWPMLLTLAAAVVLATYVPPEVRFLFGPVLILLGLVAPRKVPMLSREMELRGHMVEVLVARDVYGADFVTKLRSEAEALSRYKHFKSWTAPQIEIAMMERRGAVEGFAARID